MLTADNKTRPRILIVAGQATDRQAYQRMVSRHAGSDYLYEESEHAADALRMFSSNRLSCVILQDDLTDLTATEFMAELRAGTPEGLLPVIILGDLRSEAAAIAALRCGAQEYLAKKDLGPQDLYRAVSNVIEKTTLDQQLTEAQAQLNAKNRQLSRLYKSAHHWVDDVSDSFRGPVKIIRQFSAMLREGMPGEINDEQRKYLDIVSERADDLSRLVDDMFNVSRLESGSMDLYREPCRMQDIIERFRASLGRAASRKGATLDFSLDPDLPDIFCDSAQISLAISNLVFHALVTAAEDSTLAVRVTHQCGDSVVAVNVIQDEPRALSPRGSSEWVDAIGDKSSAQAKACGSLNVAKKLVRLNFSEITIQSRDHGATYSFGVPLAQPLELLHNYLDSISSFRDDTRFVSILQGQVNPQINSVLLDEVTRFLQNRVRRSDLVLRNTSHDWLLICPTNQRDLEPLISRIAKAWDQANRGRPEQQLPPIRLDILGTWRVEDQRDQLITRFEIETRSLQESFA